MTHWPGPGTFASHPLRQRDGVTCGPSVAIVGAALLDSHYAGRLRTAGWFAEEQQRLHRRLNRWWPRALGTTPAGMAAALSRHSAVPYRWRPARGRRDTLHDVSEALRSGAPVAMLVGGFMPRHWVLLVSIRSDGEFDCYEPSAGEVRALSPDDVRRGGMRSPGFPRAYCFVRPVSRGEGRATAPR
jgi:hypothetical protein